LTPIKKYNVTLPANGPKALYYRTHVRYFKCLLDHIKISYTLRGSVGDGDTACDNSTKFLVKIANKRIVMDFSDHYDYLPNWNTFDGYFKYHYSNAIHGPLKGIHAFAPISFYNWNEYYQYSKSINYKCNLNLVLNMQKPGGAAVLRRTQIQRYLNLRYSSGVDTSVVPQREYWTKINNCLVHVFIPGARNDILDRGHLQYLGFGCCTIAPPINDVLPYNEQLKDNLHYVQCRADYKDLLDKIEWCRTDRQGCIRTGSRAKALFQRACTPVKLWEWILRNIGI